MVIRLLTSLLSFLKDSRTESDSSTGKYDHILRHPGETEIERDNRRNKRGVTFAEGTTPTTSEMSSAESEEERPQVYSIDLYRSSWFVFGTFITNPLLMHNQPNFLLC